MAAAFAHNMLHTLQLYPRVADTAADERMHTHVPEANGFFLTIDRQRIEQVGWLGASVLTAVESDRALHVWGPVVRLAIALLPPTVTAHALGLAAEPALVAQPDAVARVLVFWSLLFFSRIRIPDDVYLFI
jgi:hypothetical protein